MVLFPKELKENKILFVISIFFLIFIVIEGFQVLNYPLIISGKVPDYHFEIARKMLPFYHLFKPVEIFPFIILNLILRIAAFINIRKMNNAGKYLGIISLIFTIILVAVMLPVNLVWEPIAMMAMLIFLIKGYARIEQK